MFEVVCEECVDFRTGRGVRRWRESCGHCAERTAANHRLEYGHQVEVREYEPLSPAVLLQRDSRTVRVAGKAGW